MLIALTGAHKNIGDFLIHERARRLLSEFLPGEKLYSYPRSQSLPPGLVASAKGIVLCGGPGLRQDFYPGTYPLVDDLPSLGVPLFSLALGLGWQERGADPHHPIDFNGTSMEALRQIESTAPINVRDEITFTALSNGAGLESRNTGCVVWYSKADLGQPFVAPQRVRRIVVTPPAHRALFPVVARLLFRIRRLFRSSVLYCAFHRGLLPELQTGVKQSAKTLAANLALAAAAEAAGFRVVDAAYDLAKIGFYRDCDLHVGFRVHAHLDMLSMRRPSILIAEDGRGVGQQQSFQDPYGLTAYDPQLVERTISAVSSEIESQFSATERSVEVIENTWPVMKHALQEIRGLTQTVRP